MNNMQYMQLLKSIRDSMSDDKKQNFDLQLAGKEKSPQTALILSLFFGGLGVDRFYLGQVKNGLLKLFTLGGFGIWTIIDWFSIMGIARQANIQTANEIKQFLA